MHGRWDQGIKLIKGETPIAKLPAGDKFLKVRAFGAGWCCCFFFFVALFSSRGPHANPVFLAQGKEGELLWEAIPVPPDCKAKYGMTTYAMGLNAPAVR